MTLIDLDLTNLPEFKENEYGPIPPGIYNAVISDVKMKLAKSGQSQYPAITFKILNGPHKDRTVFDNFCSIFNPDPEKASKGRARLGKIALSAGIATALQHLEQLQHKTLNIKVVIQPAKGDNAASNNITNFYPYGDTGESLPGYGSVPTPPLGAVPVPDYGVTGFAETSYNPAEYGPQSSENSYAPNDFGGQIPWGAPVGDAPY